MLATYAMATGCVEASGAAGYPPDRAFRDGRGHARMDECHPSPAASAGAGAQMPCPESIPMSDQLPYERRGDVLFVRFPEYETAEQVRPHIDAALALSDEFGVRKVLVDTTASAIALSSVEYTRVGQYIARRPKARELTVAILRRPDLVPEARFLEQMLESRAVRFRVFSDAGEAQEWLRESPGA